MCFTWLVDKILEARDSRNKIQVLVHEAFFLNDPQKQLYYFIKVTNLSQNNNFTITHVWVIDNKEEKEILNLEKPLPYKLETSNQWETWYPKRNIKDKTNIFKNIRVELSNGRTYRSKRNLEVRPQGFVA